MYDGGTNVTVSAAAAAISFCFHLKFPVCYLFKQRWWSLSLSRLFILSFSLALKVPFALLYIHIHAIQTHIQTHTRTHVRTLSGNRKKILNSECAFMKGIYLFFWYFLFIQFTVYDTVVYSHSIGNGILLMCFINNTFTTMWLNLYGLWVRVKRQSFDGPLSIYSIFFSLLFSVNWTSNPNTYAHIRLIVIFDRKLNSFQILYFLRSFHMRCTWDRCFETLQCRYIHTFLLHSHLTLHFEKRKKICGPKNYYQPTHTHLFSFRNYTEGEGDEKN